MTIKTKKFLTLLLSMLCLCCVLFSVGVTLNRNTQAQTDLDSIVETDYVLVLNDYEPKIEGLTKILDPNGKEIQIKRGKFTPLCVGQYKIYYGVLYKSLIVLRDNPAVDFNYSSTIASSYGTGDTLKLPTADIESIIGTYENYYVTVTCNGEEIANVHSSQVVSGYDLVFTRGGDYTITYSCTDKTSLKYTAKDVHNVTVSNDKALFMNKLPEQINFGESINIGAVYGLYNGKVYEAEVKVTTPLGKTEDVKDIVYMPQDQGKYTFVATSNIDGQTKTLTQEVNVVISTASLFTNFYSIAGTQSAVELPAYVNQEGKGLFVQASTTSSSLYYSKVIDLRNFDKNTSLIDFVPYADGNSKGQDEIKITLIDAHNTNQQLTVRWWYKSSVSNESYMVVYLNGKEYGALNNEKTADGTVVRTFYGAIGWGCYFNAYNQARTSRMFNLRFDYEENAVYSKIRDRWASNDSIDKIIDMDDPIALGYSNIWSGFTTGEVYLKVEFVSAQPTSAIYIASIAGVKLDQELLPDAINETCFMVDSEYEELPDGAVDYFYSFPKIIKNNLLDINVETTLTKGNTVVPCTEKGFTPTEAGDYVLKYSAIDNFGKKVEKIYPFTVNATPNPINIELPSDIDVDMFTTYTIPTINVTGGCGNLDVKTEMWCGDKRLESNTGSYLIDSAEDYKIKIFVTDFIGYPAEKEYTLNVDKDYVSLQLESNIISLRAGKKITLPKAISVDYLNSTTPAITLDVVGNGNVIKTFTGTEAYSFDVPEGYSELTLNYYSAKGTERAKLLSKTVKVLPKDFGKDISNFVMMEGAVSALSLNEGIAYTATDDAIIKFPNPVPASGLELVFSVDKEKVANFDGFTIRLIDSVNPELVVEFNVYDIGVSNTSKIEVNEDGRIFSGKYKTYQYKDDKNYNTERKAYVGKDYYSYESKYDAVLNKLNYADGSEMASAIQLKDGTPFAGFASGLVFVEFEFNGVKENSKATIIIKGVSNQNMTFFTEQNYKDFDTAGPRLLFEEKMVNSRVVLNTELTISTAKAYDLIQAVSAGVTVTVTAPNKTKVIDNQTLAENRIITLDQFGAYTVVYTTRDSLNKTTREEYTIEVYDDKAPTIVIDGTVNKEYAVGSSIKLPKANVTDNVSVNLVAKVYIKDPNTIYETLTNKTSYKFEQKGIYLLVFSAEDEFGNLSRVTYEIKVK